MVPEVRSLFVDVEQLILLMLLCPVSSCAAERLSNITFLIFAVFMCNDAVNCAKSTKGSPNVRRLRIKVEVFEAFQQTAHGIYLCNNL